MDHPSDRPAPRSAREEIRHAADHIAQAADDAVEVVMPRQLRGHLRDATRHLFQAGIAAIDAVDRHARMREERRQRRTESAPRPSSAETSAADDIAGSHTPGCL